MTRTNLLPNGAFGTVTGWVAQQAAISADSGRMRVVPSSGSWTVSSTPATVSPGQWVSLAADITTDQAPVDLCLRFTGTDAPMPRASAPTRSDDRAVVTAQAPAGATAVQAVLAASPGGAGADTQTFWADSAILQVGGTAGDVSDTSFFDGDTPPVRVGDTGQALVHSWTGVPGGSASREEIGNWPIRTLTAIIPAGDGPVVQVVVPGSLARSGTPVKVTGHTPNGFSWTVRGSGRMGQDSQLVLGDALAPVNTPLTYRMVQSWDGQTVESTPVTRPWSGRSLMTDVIGGSRLDLIWQGDDARAPVQRITAHEIPGRSTPVMVFAPVMGAGTVSLTARTSGAHTQEMAALASRPTVVLLLHNPARCFQCRRGACDVPLTTVMALTSVSQARTPRQDQAERAWSIKGTICSIPEPQRIVGVSDWDDFDAVGLTWVRLDAMGLTWDEFDATIWQEVR